MEFSVLEQSDLQLATEVFIRAFGQKPWDERWPPANAYRRLKQIHESPDSLGVKAQNAGNLVGFALGRCEQSLASQHFNLMEMCVDPVYQGKGAGKAVLAHLTSLLAANGVRQIYLITHRDTAAESFYKGQGFRSAQRAVVMVRRNGHV